MILERPHTCRRRRRLFEGLVLLTLLLTACGAESDRPFVARVGDAKLYPSDLDQYIPATASSEDSSKRAKVIINNWVREQVVLQQAEFNLDGDEERFKVKVDEYLNDLIIYEYENRFVREKLDTLVSQEESMAYYEAHQEEFILREDALRLRYALFDSRTEQVDELAKKMERYNELDSMDIAIFNESHAERSSDRVDQWIYMTDLLEELPSAFAENTRDRFSSVGFTDMEKSGRRLLFEVVEYLPKGGVSPYGLERERIRNTILNTRKVAMLEEMRSNLFSDAIRNGDIEIQGE